MTRTPTLQQPKAIVEVAERAFDLAIAIEKAGRVTVGLQELLTEAALQLEAECLNYTRCSDPMCSRHKLVRRLRVKAEELRP